MVDLVGRLRTRKKDEAKWLRERKEAKVGSKLDWPLSVSLIAAAESRSSALDSKRATT